ncbi:hypothetical protein [Vreelandella populi]|uniref:Uncharacterized protein n=1 Tax=Vreelandella populi TaxID=2498858 RepID=A0A3S1E638_9GAMM|nr:hypothetical protein [Halomonas populi]RUR41365.1 hypothetical protein ELY25_02835 [Halomonas populi]RUR44231.1 hypothetical protein ELY37_14090 [Halomonas populi]RUR56223.1 hypothetical protein ELY40_03420 [Halomonas populi]
MSQDQAAGLRQWADAQRLKHAYTADDASGLLDAEPASAAPLQPEWTPAAQVPAPARQALKKPLFIIGVTGHGVQAVSRVKSRLVQWSELGRTWAGSPDDWDIHLVNVAGPDLARLSAQHTRWALWINSDAQAFSQMYRVLREARENGGPQRLLALHEPHLSRQGLLNNLRDAAAHYLATDLLLLAR